MNPIREAVKILPGQWHKGKMGQEGQPRCGLGHVATVLGNEQADLFNEITSTLTQAAADKFPDRTKRSTTNDFFFAWFNDHPDTTEQDVIDVMNLAAERWDIEH